VCFCAMRLGDRYRRFGVYLCYSCSDSNLNGSCVSFLSSRVSPIVVVAGDSV